MKKLFVIALAVFMVFGVSTVAMASFQVEVKANSEGVTAAEGACEKAGSLAFTFDEGTVLRDGDWWYADLPLGVTLCHSIDFAVLGVAGGVAPGAGGLPIAVIAVPADGATVTAGFLSIIDTEVDGNLGNIAIAGTSPLWFRVSGATGSTRVMIQVFDSDNIDYRNIANADGTTTLTVGNNTAFQIVLFDSDFHAPPLDPTGPWGVNDTDAPIDGQYGDDGAADILGVANDWDNTYCIDAFGYAFQTIDVSINSGGVSGANFLNFNPTNPEVAHLIGTTAINLVLCKADEFGFVSLEPGQAATCRFDYESPTIIADGYCADIGTANFTGSVVTGNKIIVQNSTTTFFNAGDNYRLVLRISGNGAYWGAAAPGWVQGYTPAQTDYCDQDGTGVGSTPVAIGGWAVATETAVVAGGGHNPAGCGPIAADDAFVSLTSQAFTGIDTYNTIEINLPNIVYDPTQFSSGDQVTVTVELWRLPCGLIFTGDRIVAQFVDTCAAAAPVTTLYYPYSVELNGSSGWWFGVTIGNPTAAAGTAMITVYEADGDIGTYTTAAIGAFGLLVHSGSELLGLLTPDPANTGTLGDSRTHIIVNCNFGGAGGFGMMGNGMDSTGYTAYGNSVMWNY